MSTDVRPGRKGRRNFHPGGRGKRRGSPREMAAALREVLHLGGERLGDKVEDAINPFVSREKRVPRVGEICPVGIVPDRVCRMECHGLSRQVIHKFSGCSSWVEAVKLFAAYAPRLAEEIIQVAESDEVSVSVVHRTWVEVTAGHRDSCIGRFEASASGLVNIARMFGYLPTPSATGGLCLRIGGTEYQCDEYGGIDEGFISSFAECLTRIGGMYVIPRYLSDAERELLPYLETLFEWRSVGGKLECGVACEIEGGALTAHCTEIFTRAARKMAAWTPDSLHMFDFDLLSLDFVRECDIGLWNVLPTPPATHAEALVDEAVNSIIASCDWTVGCDNVPLSDIRREIRVSWSPYFSLLNTAALQMEESLARSFVADLEASSADCVRHVVHQWERERAMIAPAATELLRQSAACATEGEYSFEGHAGVPASAIVATLTQVGLGVARAYGFKPGGFDNLDAARNGRWTRGDVSWYRELLHRGNQRVIVTPRARKTSLWVRPDGIQWVRECHGCARCVSHEGLHLCLLHDHDNVPLWRRVQNGRGRSWCGHPWCDDGVGRGEKQVSGIYPVSLSRPPDPGMAKPPVHGVGGTNVWEILERLPRDENGEVLDLEPPRPADIARMLRTYDLRVGYSGPRQLVHSPGPPVTLGAHEYDAMVSDLFRDCSYLANAGPDAALAGELAVKWAMFKSTWTRGEKCDALTPMTGPFGDPTD